MRMDTSDLTLQFDKRGWCQYCRTFKAILLNWHPDERGLSNHAGH